MRKQLKAFRKQEGFTLIELMIVVAIIGILAAIAIPNFIAYQAKSKQAEAKVSLGAIFTSAVAYQAETLPQTYLPDVVGRLGYIPAGSSRYAFYFAQGTAAPGTPEKFPGAPLTGPGCNTDAPPATVMAVGADTFGFTAGAIGNIDGDGACDEWHMNDRRLLTNDKNDVSATS